MSGLFDLPELDCADVAVAGGGPAGVAAAVAASRRGARVVLLEKGGCCGGLGTQGMVPMIFVGHDANRGEQAGFLREVLSMHGELSGEAETSYWQTTNAEVMKRVYDVKLAEAGVIVYYDVKVAAVEKDGGRIKSLVVATANGLKKVPGKVFVDGTGDGMVGFLAGCDFEYGDAGGRVMSPTLCVQYAGIDNAAVAASEREGRSAHKAWHDLSERGEAPENEQHFVGVRTFGRSLGGGNLGHIYETDVLSEKSVSAAYTEGRRLAWSYLDFYRRHVDGYYAAELSATASLLGVRESRRLKCDYMLGVDDYRDRAVFDDEIGRFSYPVDIHAAVKDAAEQKKVEQVLRASSYKPGESYGVPYRSLCVSGLENLLVGGRCAGTDRAVQSSLRVISGAILTGQACGLAAAAAASGCGSVRAIDTAELRKGMSDF